jgi:hypothetical protein
MERDRFFTADQAVEYGLIDGIIESRDIGPSRGTPASSNGAGADDAGAESSPDA